MHGRGDCADAGDALNSKPITILVVEDEPAHLEFIQHVFEKRAARGAYNVHSATNLAKAKAWLLQHRPDAVLTDLILPDGCGSDLIPVPDATPVYPVLIMTAHGDEEVAAACIKAGALDYVVKTPETLADLPRLVARALREWQQIVARREAEARVHESQLRLDAILTSMDDLLFVFDTDMRFVFCHALSSSDLAFPDVEFLGKTHGAVMPPAIDRLFVDAFERNRKGETAEFEYDLRAGRKLQTWSVKMSPFMESETFAGAVAVVRNITQRKKVEDALRQSREELRALTLRSLMVREEECRRISREIHDNLGQTLTALTMDLTWLAGRLRADQAPLVAKVAIMSSLLVDTVGQVQRITAELRPVLLDDAGLVPAIEWEIEQFESRFGVRCEFTSCRGEIAFDHDCEIVVFRVLQEALTNVARHAGAKRVEIRIRRTKGNLELRIADDGRGITREQVTASSSLGLVGMRERAAACNGDIRVRGKQGEGTVVILTIPMTCRSAG